MIYETYTCSKVGGWLEYGFCFKEAEGDSDCTSFDLVLGNIKPGPGADALMQDAWLEFEWAAKAIVNAAEKTS